MRSNSQPPSTNSLERIPVYIISGFLGSGKTTLLNRLLTEYPKSAVIINEFGSTPIDQQLLRAHKVPLSTLVGGCLCCQVIGALTPLLRNLRLAWEKDHDIFERIIIETSGVANPEPVLDIILRERWLSKRYHLQGVIVTVSAAMTPDLLDTYPEAQAQIAWADTLILTQTDLAAPAMIAKWDERLLSLLPSATRMNALNGVVDFDILLNGAPQYRPLRHTKMPDLPEHVFNSVTLRIEQPLPEAQIEKALQTLLAKYANNLVRVKGMLYTLNDLHPLLVQGTGEQLFPSIRLPVRDIDDGVGRVVIIARGNVEVMAKVLMAELRGDLKT